MRIEFEKLEQRPGAHTVPVKMTREELEQVAEEMSRLTTRIEAREEDLRSYQKEMREEIKELEEERSAANRTYRFKREPKMIDGLWGFDPEDNGRVKCKTCVEAAEKQAEAERVEIPSYETEKALKKAHKEIDHPLVTVWERPLGTKWFVQPDTGDVYGPLSITERDLQKPLPAPETKSIEPFKLAFDVDTAVPLLDERERGEAEQKLKDTEAARERAVADGTTNLCPQCGLPLDDHPELADDPCKAAMLAAADRANAEQAERTEKKYGADEVLDPEQTYPCGKCETPTFGKDLQPVTIDGAKRFVCFPCEQGIANEKPKKQKRTRKPKGGSDEAAAV